MSKYNFDFLENYILENDRARLSPLQLEHIDALAPISENEVIWTYFLENGKGLKNLTRYVQSAIKKRKVEEEYPFVIFDKKTNQFAGITRLYAFDPSLGNIKMGHTWYGKSFWGTGLNTQCKSLLFQFCFATLGLERIGFGVHAENIRSIKALEKLGCRQEGELRSFLNKIDLSGRVSLLLFGILKEEWMANPMFNTPKIN